MKRARKSKVPPVPAASAPEGTGLFQRRLSRREFVKSTGLLALSATSAPAILAACGTSPSTKSGTKSGPKTLKVLQWSHFVPKYDTWFDPYAQSWGQKNNVTITVDHINNALLPARTAAEISAGSGHDLIEWITSPSQYEPGVLDLSDVVTEAAKKYGSQIPFCKASSYNPKTNKFYGFCHGYAPDPGDYRKSDFSAVGLPDGPTTYDQLLTAATAIYKTKKLRLGLGMSPEVDSNMASRALIWSYGGSIQDANENVVFNSPQTVAAVEWMVKAFKQAMSSEVFSWTAASNNQGLVAGQLSYILNSISAYRTAQTTRPDIANDIFFVPALKGPSGTGLVGEHVVYVYIIPSFSKNADTAKQFILDLVGHYHDAVYNSELYNFPSFTNTGAQSALFSSGGWLDNDPFGSHPANKLQVLKSAQSWSTNVGYPGPSSAAVGEVFNTFVLPNMMASAAKGQASPQQAVANADSQIKAIFQKWRQKGLVGGSS
ncbi:MAG: ABC transporter substrate-binding protein [Candidatus Dormibacterales bacterium]